MSVQQLQAGFLLPCCRSVTQSVYTRPGSGIYRGLGLQLDCTARFSTNPRPRTTINGLLINCGHQSRIRGQWGHRVAAREINPTTYAKFSPTSPPRLETGPRQSRVGYCRDCYCYRWQQATYKAWWKLFYLGQLQELSLSVGHSPDCSLHILMLHLGNDDIGHKRHRPQHAPYRVCVRLCVWLSVSCWRIKIHISAIHNAGIGHKLRNISKKEWKWNAGM